jgi:hypothetical protein
VEAAQEPGDRHVVLQDSGRAFDQLRGMVSPGRSGLTANGFRRRAAPGQRAAASDRAVIDREHDRYTERITDEAGNVAREIDEPPSQHRGHGAAKRCGSQPGPGVGGL